MFIVLYRVLLVVILLSILSCAPKPSIQIFNSDALKNISTIAIAPTVENKEYENKRSTAFRLYSGFDGLDSFESYFKEQVKRITTIKWVLPDSIKNFIESQTGTIFDVSNDKYIKTDTYLDLAEDLNVDAMIITNISTRFDPRTPYSGELCKAFSFLKLFKSRSKEKIIEINVTSPTTPKCSETIDYVVLESINLLFKELKRPSSPK